jgi:hypothetical protein
MALKDKIAIATGVIKLASNLGLPVDVLSGVFGGATSEDKLDQLADELARLQTTVEEGFYSANQNGAYVQIQQALAKSLSASLIINNPVASESAKADARDDVRDGISNVAGAVTSLLNNQTGSLTPAIVQDMYQALAFALTVQINASAAYSFGEEIDGSRTHGGFWAEQTQIQAGIDALKLLEPTIKDAYFQGVTVTDVVGEVIRMPIGQFSERVEVTRSKIEITHSIEDLNEARAFYLEFFLEILNVEDRDLGDSFFNVTANTVTFIMPTPYEGLILPNPFIDNDVGNNDFSVIPLVLPVGFHQDKLNRYTREIELTAGDFAYSRLIGEKVDLTPGQASNPFHSWNEPGPSAFDELIAAAEATLNGIVVRDTEDGEQQLMGTDGNDFLIADTGGDIRFKSGQNGAGDRLFGGAGDDYLMGGSRNNLMSGGEGSDRYFNASGFYDPQKEKYTRFGQDGFIDDGTGVDDIDVVVFEGNRDDYSFYDDTGTTGPRIKVVRAGDIEADTIRGIEFLKFDDVEVDVSTLSVANGTLRPKDSDAPVAPVISDANGAVVSGTAEANSFVTVSTDTGQAVITQTNDSGVWSYNFAADTDVEDGIYTLTAFASDGVNNSSGTSASFSATVDKTGPSLSVAGLTTSNADGALAQVGDTLTLVFTASEVLAGLPEVTLAGSTAAVTDLGGNSFRAVLTLDTAAAAGGVAFLINMTDLAGNDGTGDTVTDGSAITIEIPVINVPQNEIDGDGENNILVGSGGGDLIRGFAGDDYIYADGFELRYGLPEANQVFRLYQATFNRTPDEAGHERWASELFAGTATLEQVREGFVRSQEFKNKYAGLDDADFVKELYINVLDRDFNQGEVTQTEIDNWTNRITETFARADVVNGFAESPQLINTTLQAANKLAVNSNAASWSDDVYRLYQATLDRAPDMTGFANWSGRLADGRPLTDVIPSFTNSQEFANTYGILNDPEDFVKLLYNNVLDRDFSLGEVTQSEVDGWTSQLSETFTRANIVQGFSQSREFTNNTADDVKAWIRANGVDDQVDGGTGTNVLAGGSLADHFVFSQADGATNTVLDLEAWDYLTFDGFGYSSAAEARGHMAQSASSIVFADQGTEVTFERFQLSSVTDDMILV